MSRHEPTKPGGPLDSVGAAELLEAIPLDTLRVAGEPVLGYSRDDGGVRQRHGARFAFLLATLILVSTLGLITSVWVNAKMRLIDSIPGLGPADWALVLREPAMRDLAWRIVENDYRLDSVGLYSRHREVFQTDVLFPLRYQAGELHISLRITNTGTLPGIVPSIEARNETVSYDPATPTYFAAISLRLGPFLGTGARVLQPGQSLVDEAVIRTIETPHPIYILAVDSTLPPAMAGSTAGLPGAIRIQPEGAELFEPLPYERWEDVPPTALQRD